MTIASLLVNTKEVFLFIFFLIKKDIEKKTNCKKEKGDTKPKNLSSLLLLKDVFSESKTVGSTLSTI